jgi:phosphatidylglycerol phospholipase C
VSAFQAAVDAGCDVIETDLHISADGYIVIAHDIDTLRVFGEKHIITATNYIGVLDQLLTLREPRSRMPIFEEVLQWAIDVNNRTDGRVIKLMLDIKADNDPNQLYVLMWKCFEKLNSVDYWKDKIIFGLWRSSFYVHDLLKQFEVINITFDVRIAQKFYSDIKQIHPDARLDAVSITHFMLYRGQDFAELLEWASTNGIKLWYWTVNDNIELKYAVEHTRHPGGVSLLKGIITDDPIKVVAEDANNISITRYNINWWIKKNFFSIFLFFFRRGYNMRPIFLFLAKIGFL